MNGILKYFDLDNATFNRFTDRARLVMAVAEQFAFEQIEPEHILRALASISRGVGRVALEELGVDLFNLLPTIVDLSPTCTIHDSTEHELSACSMRVLSEARKSALDFNHNYLGTEHLTLGLIKVSDSAAAHFLRSHRITYDNAVIAIKQLLDASDSAYEIVE